MLRNCLLIVFVIQLLNAQNLTGVQQTQDYDILIRGGTIVDGSGSKGYRADVLVKEGTIVYIGKVDRSKIKVGEVIDATGKVVSPGFIDSHAHGNPLKTPHFHNFSAMGVTTIVLGQDGSSAKNIGLWLKEVEEARPAINITTLVGHGSMRHEAGIRLDPNPSEEQLKQMADLVDEALQEGAFGLSTGLEYQPGTFSDLDELIAIGKPVSKRGGIVHSHTRNEDNDAVDSSLAELFAMGKGAGCAVQVSHLKVVYGKGTERAEQILAQMDAARESGLAVTADIYPYTASYTGIGILFPDWALPPHDYTDVVATQREKLEAYLRRRVNLRNGPEATLLGTAPWAGKTLAQVAAESGKPFEDVLIDDIGPDGASAAYFVMDRELQDRLFIDPHVMACSDGSPTMRHPRGYGSFAKVIRYYVREQKLLTLEEAVRKMSGLPAETLGLTRQKRGLLKEGFAADILVFDPARVKDTATFENPHQLAEGFDWVLVNGVVVRENSSFTGQHGGRVLKRKKDLINSPPAR